MCFLLHPVLHLEVGNAFKFARIVCNHGNVSGQGLSGDLDIVGADWRALAFKIAADFAGENRVVRSEGNNIKRRKEHG